MAWGQPEPRIAFGQESDSCISLGMQCNEHTRNAAASSARWVPDILSAALRNSVPDSEGFFNAGVDVYTTTLLAILLPLALAFVYRHKMNSQKVPFRFLDLPAELREMVYDNLLEEPSYHTHVSGAFRPSSSGYKSSKQEANPRISNVLRLRLTSFP